MKIITLMENTSVSPEFESYHGLSFYIETRNHRILFDMGPNDGFIRNAEKLNVDLKKIDFAILSHGHYDHGGGLKAFMEINPNAKIHLQKKAFGDFYAHDPDGKIRYIGLPKELKEHPQLVFHTGDYKLDAEIQIFAGITGRECYSPANDRLFMSINERHIPDLFMHEQNLLIREGNKVVLIAGCAHNGILNIMNKAENLVSGSIDYVVGGMHLKNAYEDKTQQRMFCKKMAESLKKRESNYYTCHCTSEEAYEMLHEDMGERICYLAAGRILEL